MGGFFGKRALVPAIGVGLSMKTFLMRARLRVTRGRRLFLHLAWS